MPPKFRSPCWFRRTRIWNVFSRATRWWSYLDEEAKVIAGTGGIVGIRYLPGGVMDYKHLADEVEYLCKLIGPDSSRRRLAGTRQKVNPDRFEVEGHLSKTYSGVETEGIYRALRHLHQDAVGAGNHRRADRHDPGRKLSARLEADSSRLCCAGIVTAFDFLNSNGLRVTGSACLPSSRIR